jgi:hypothetical protein
MLGEFEPSEINPVQTLILAAPAEAGVIQKLLEEAAPGKYEVLARYQDLSDMGALTDILASRATLVVVHQSVANFTVQMLHEIAYARGHSAKVVAAIVSPLGDVFDAVLSSGAVPFRLPTRPEIFRQVDEAYPELLAEASERLAEAREIPPAPPEPAKTRLGSFPGAVRQALRW